MPRSSALLAGDLPIPNRARHIAPFLLPSPGKVFRTADFLFLARLHPRAYTLVNSEAHGLHIYGHHSEMERIREYRNENRPLLWRSPETRL